MFALENGVKIQEDCDSGDSAGVKPRAEAAHRASEVVSETAQPADQKSNRHTKPGVGGDAGPYNFPARKEGFERCCLQVRAYRERLYAERHLPFPDPLPENSVDRLNRDWHDTAADNPNVVHNEVAAVAERRAREAYERGDDFKHSIAEMTEMGKAEHQGLAALDVKRLQALRELHRTRIKVKQIEKATAQLEEAKAKQWLAAAPTEPGRQSQLAQCTYATKLAEKERLEAVVEELKVESELNRAVQKEHDEMIDTIALLKRWSRTHQIYRRQQAAGTTTRYYSDCHQENGLGAHFCQVLGRRPGWKKYPSEPWFKTEKGVQMHSPSGHVTVDYTDQSVYSKHESWISGSDCLHSKYKLPQTLEGCDYFPPNYEIQQQAWVGGRAPPDTMRGPFFVKDGMRNWATGVFVVGSASECLEISEPGVSYVVQPAVRDPLLVEGCKFHLRIYFMLLSQKGSTSFKGHWCKVGFVVKAHKPYDEGDLDKMVQVSRDRFMLISEWEHHERVMPSVYEMLIDAVRRALPQLESPEEKASFDLFGADVMVDQAFRTHLLEINRSPLIKEPDFWLLHGLLSLVVGPIDEDDRAHEVEWEPMVGLHDDGASCSMTSS